MSRTVNHSHLLFRTGTATETATFYTIIWQLKHIKSEWGRKEGKMEDKKSLLHFFNVEEFNYVSQMRTSSNKLFQKF